MNKNIYEELFAEMQSLSRQINTLSELMESKIDVWDGKDDESLYRTFRDMCIFSSSYFRVMADSAVVAKLDGVKIEDYMKKINDI